MLKKDTTPAKYQKLQGLMPSMRLDSAGGLSWWTQLVNVHDANKDLVHIHKRLASVVSKASWFSRDHLLLSSEGRRGPVCALAYMA